MRRGNMRVVLRFLPAAAVLPALRFAVTVGLVAVLVGGVGRWWRQSPAVTAVEAPSEVKASAPVNIQQSTSGLGLMTFDTTVTDKNLQPTKLRVEYSVDEGKTWHKAALSGAKVAIGSVDVNASLPYQIGSNNSIDTNTESSIKVNVTWDTKSVQNLGGALVGDVSGVKLRVTARDLNTVGPAAISGAFRVDNKAPLGLDDFQVVGASGSEVQLSWRPPTDSSLFSYQVFFGTDATAVTNRTSDVWDTEDDSTLDDIEATGTIISGLTPETTYAFKLVVQDIFGNESSSSRVSGATAAAGSESLLLASPIPSGLTSPSTLPSVSPTPRPVAPPTTFRNRRPLADAGADQVVNPNALVILDGTASLDPDGDVLTYTWRQLSGPRVDVLSARTATPSFSAGSENETYIFSLTVRDTQGASATDIMTVATKALPVGATTPVTVTAPPPTGGAVTPEGQVPRSAAEIALRIVDIFLFVLAGATAAISLIDRAARRWREGAGVASPEGAGGTSGRVVHYKTGEPIVGANVLVYGSDGKLKHAERTNVRGEFSTLFPAGTYTIGVQVEGFGFAPITASAPGVQEGIVYTGGTVTVHDGSRPVAITIPLKPTGEEVGSLRVGLLHLWQSIQRWGRLLSWPVFLLGAGVNTFLIFWSPTLLYLAMEALYVVLVIVKVALEVRIRPAYGLVRDAITHVPLDLAVVRLYEAGTNRLVMTRVTNGQGKFFALPPAGNYIITVTKTGYAVFSKQNVVIAGDEDSALQMTTDLMPVTPPAGLAAARAAVL